MKPLRVAIAVAVAVALSGAGTAASQGKGHGASKAKKTPAIARHIGKNQKAKPAKTFKQGRKADKQAGTTGRRTPVQVRLDNNPALVGRLRSRLPADIDVIHAADGFRNLGQYVAAVNVSRNLSIPFPDLRRRMVDDGMSLGQAIRAERRDVDAIRIARRAEQDADALIVETTRAKSPKRRY